MELTESCREVRQEGKKGRRNRIFKTSFIQETVCSQIRYTHIIYHKTMTTKGNRNIRLPVSSLFSYVNVPKLRLVIHVLKEK